MTVNYTVDGRWALQPHRVAVVRAKVYFNSVLDAPLLV